MLQLHELKPFPGSRRKRKIRGRGDSSGRGSYSGRGIKGQKARSGVGGLKYLGLRRMVLSIPKKRGFQSIRQKPQVINIGVLERRFTAEETVSPKALLEKGIVGTITYGVKILGEGELTKKLTIEGCGLSKSAKEKIEKEGGVIK